MEIVRVLAGYSLGRSDLVRRAMSKKKADVMAEERKNFVYGIEGEVDGCVKNGIPAEVAEEIFDLMTDFAKYAFNKSHAGCYALVGYQTAWLKTYYPVEFMAALLTSVMDNKAKVTGYVEDCKKMGITILPPDINEGYSHFSVWNGKIRFALSAIKNVGKGAVNEIVFERDENGSFTSMTKFCNRMEQGVLNKRLIENLIKAGAFDSLGGFRQQYISVYKNILDDIASSKKNNCVGQISLFDVGFSEEENDSLNDSLNDNLPNIAEFLDREKFAMEKEVIGVYVSGHPLEEYKEIIPLKTSHKTTDFVVPESDEEFNEEEQKYITENTKVILGGMINTVSVKFTKRNDKMAFISLEDFYGTIEVIVFPQVYKRYMDKLVLDKAIILEGKTSVDADGSVKIIADSIKELTVSTEEIPKSIWIKIPSQNTISVTEILPVLKKHLGGVPVYLYNESTKEKMKAEKNHWVDGGKECVENLQFLIGKENVVTKYN